MTECQYYQELISRLTDEELSKREHSALSAHVETCKQCMTMYLVFSDLSDIIKNDVSELPDGLHENIMANIHRNAIVKKHRRRFSASAKNLIAAAACFAVVLFTASGLVTKFSREASSKLSADTVFEVSVSASPAAAAASAVPQSKPSVDVSSPEAGAANAAIYASPEPTVFVSTPPPQATAEPVTTADPYLGTKTAPAPELPAQPERSAAPQVQSEVLPSAAPSPAPPDAPSATDSLESAAVPSAAPSVSAAGAASSGAAVSPAPKSPSALAPSGNSSASSVPAGSPDTAVAPEPPSTSSRVGMMFRSMLGISEEPEVQTADVTVDMTKDKDCAEAELWTELHKMLSTVKPAESAATPSPSASPRPSETPMPTELPAEKPDRLFDIALTEDGCPCSILIYQYADELYYSVPKEMDDTGVYLAKCTLDDFIKFISLYPTEGLTAEECAAAAE